MRYLRPLLWPALGLCAISACAGSPLGNVDFYKWGTHYALIIKTDTVSVCVTKNGQPVSNKGATGGMSFKQRQPPRVVRFDFVPYGKNCLRVENITPQLSAGDQFRAKVNPPDRAEISMTVVVPGVSTVPTNARAILGPAKRAIVSAPPASSTWQVPTQAASPTQDVEAGNKMRMAPTERDKVRDQSHPGNSATLAKSTTRRTDTTSLFTRGAGSTARQESLRITILLSILFAAFTLLAAFLLELLQAYKRRLESRSGTPHGKALRDEIWNNPFRVLEVGLGATRAEIERAGQRLLALLQVDSESAKFYATPDGPKARSADAVRQALTALRNPSERIFHELWAEAASSGDVAKQDRHGTDTPSRLPA